MDFRKSPKTNVTVAEVVYLQQIDSINLFLQSLQENRF